MRSSRRSYIPWAYFRLAVLVGGLQALGRRAEVAQRFAQSNYRDHLDAYTCRIAIAEMLANVWDASWDRCEEAAQWLREAVQRKGGMLVGLGWSHFALGLVSLERNKLDAALQHFGSVTTIAYGANLQSVAHSLVGLALIYQDQGQTERADAAATECQRIAEAANAPDLLVQARSVQARLALMRGDRDTALRLVSLLPDIPPSPVNMMWVDAPLITRARVWLAQDTPVATARARRVLGELLAWSRASHSVRREIELLVLSALAYEQAGRREHAIDSLGQAVRLAQLRGSVRVFLWAGQPLVPLLGFLQARGIEPRFVDHLLAQFLAVLPESDLARARQQPRHAIHLIEPLTNREMEVLEAIAQRRTNKEIAARLVIAPTTVQRHLSNLFQKLDVANRRDAVDKARELGVLD